MTRIGTIGATLLLLAVASCAAQDPASSSGDPPTLSHVLRDHHPALLPQRLEGTPLTYEFLTGTAFAETRQGESLIARDLLAAIGTDPAGYDLVRALNVQVEGLEGLAAFEFHGLASDRIRAGYKATMERHLHASWQATEVDRHRVDYWTDNDEITEHLLVIGDVAFVILAYDPQIAADALDHIIEAMATR